MFVLLNILLCISCGANQSVRDQSSALLRGSAFDVDIIGAIVLVDEVKNVVQLLSNDRAVLASIGGAGWDNNQFDRPLGVWARNGIDIFIADYGNHRIQRFDRKLAFISSFSTRERTTPDERFGYPTDVAISRLGDLFICDGENSRILKVVGFNKIEKTFGGFDAGKGRLKRPEQIEVGPNDNVYVQDGTRIVEFDNFGNFIREFAGEMFDGKPLLYADENGLGVFNSQRLFVFDKDDRLQKTVLLDSLLQERKVHAFALSRGALYMLTDRGIIQAPDPR
jgi:hypothetical protein